MPTVLPKRLRAYEFLGLSLKWGEGEEFATSDCPLCGREGKFSINAESGTYKCWICRGESQPFYSFLSWLWEVSSETTKGYEELARNRKLLSQNTLRDWGVVKNKLTGEWMLPGYNPEGILCNLYKYVRVKGRMALLPTPGTNHQLFGLPLFSKDKKDVYIAEGPWDAMALWEVLGVCKNTEEGKLIPTASKESCLRATSNVLAVPSCSVYSEHWNPLFKGKNVVLLFDSDHPRLDPQGKEVLGGGYLGMERVARLLGDAPEGIGYLCWGEKGFDPSKPSGYDIRDLLTGR